MNWLPPNTNTGPWTISGVPSQMSAGQTYEFTITSSAVYPYGGPYSMSAGLAWMSINNGPWNTTGGVIISSYFPGSITVKLYFPTTITQDYFYPQWSQYVFVDNTDTQGSANYFNLKGINSVNAERDRNKRRCCPCETCSV